MKLLLDTCSFLWLAQEPDALSAKAKERLDEPGISISLSDVSVWEITMKHAAGKLPLPEEPRGWIERKREYHLLEGLPISREALYLSGELPMVHRDPFDRLLAAEAILGGYTIVSPDQPLSDLGAARVW